VIAVVKPGLLTTIQDAGRPGWLAFGMPLAGAVDAESYALANLLAGNAAGAAALELTLLGATLRFEADAYVGVAGADMRATLDGAPVAPGSAFAVPRGGVLAFSSAVDGCRTYLAVRGGIDVPPFLGSRSTYARGGVGGLGGRALAAGDRLPIGAVAGRPPPARSLRAQDMPPRERSIALRVLPGPQDDRFTPGGVATFLGAPYTVSNRNDRMGYHLEGPTIAHRHGPDIVSDALLPGAVQVPGSGTPIVMMADAHTVGGYAKIATVIGADLPKLAQAVRGDTVRFVRCGEAEAVRALREARDRLARIAAALEPPSRPMRRGG
jgi:antagonist of KipI